MLNDRAFYEGIWKSRPHYCYECGKWLGPEALSIFFHHVLAKEKYPHLRHEEKIVALLCWDDHSQAEINVDKTPKIKALKEQLENQYNRNGNE